MNEFENSVVIHSIYGKGIVTSISDKYIWVKFKDKETKFSFPGSFEKYLVFEDPSLQKTIEKVLPKPKEARMITQEKTFTYQPVDTDLANHETARTVRLSSKIRESETGIYILNFQAPSSYDELAWSYYDNDEITNLEELFIGEEDGSVVWSVPRYADVGDTVIFLCANTSTGSYHLYKAIREAAEIEDWDVRDFGLDEREEYKEYAGKFLCVGKVIGFSAEEERNRNLIYAEIGELQFLENFVTSREVNDYIKLNSFGSVTSLKKDQWDKLKSLIKERNPDMNI